MSNDERREKRVQASLRVRYKSATVSDFIEKHSHDISPGGVFIRSQKPLAKGSLLKIDFRLEDDTAVIRGVGRVVWTREDLGNNKPAGMGIKFIRLDADSEQNIHKIISMQKAGKDITRESVFGEENIGEYAGDDSEGDDTEDEITVPDGRSVSDSMAPSVENMTSDDVEIDGASDLDSGSDGGEVDKDAEESESSVPTDPEARDDEDDDDLKPDKPSIPPATVFPAEEEKGSHWGLVLIVILVIAGALAFLLTRSSQKDTTDTTLEGDDAVATDAAEDIEPDPSRADTALDASVKPSEAVAATVDTETATDSSATPDSASATQMDSASDADSATGTDITTAQDTSSATGSTVDTEEKVDMAPTATGAASGPITITLAQDDAKVSIDGVVQEGGSPLTLASLPAGEHTIEAALFGFRPLEKTFTAVAGEPLELSYKLIRCHIVTTLKANVLGAEVFVDNERVGVTPKRLKKRFNQSFEYRFSKRGFEDYHGTVTPADWEYDAGVYRLLLDIDLVPKTETPIDASSSNAATASGASAN